MSKFTLPDLGEGLQEAEVVQWLVAEGEKVSADQLVVLVETAKAVVEIPAPAAGLITRLAAETGAMLKVGQVLFEYTSTDQRESVSVVGELAQIAETQHNMFESDIYDSAEIKSSTVCINTFKDSKKQVHSEPSSDNLVAPELMILAKKLGLEDVLKKTHYGEICLHDLLKIYEDKQAGKGAHVCTDAAHTEALSGARKVMAQVMAKSHEQVSCATLFDDVDISHWADKEDITIRMIMAIIYACQQVPLLNSWYNAENSSIHYHSGVHLGLAVNSDAGLFVPVLRDCQLLSAKAIRRQINQFRQQINDRTIPAKDLLGASISLSNFGTLCGRYATPIIVPPQVCIIGAGRIQEQALIKNHKVVAGTILPLSISFDHRIATGGEVARFMAAIMEHLSRS